MINIYYYLVVIIIVSSSSSYIVIVSGCDRCVHQSKAAYFSTNDALSSGACGYGSMALGFNAAAALPSIYKNGAACGACFQIRCTKTNVCSQKGTKVTVVSDVNMGKNSNSTDFVITKTAFMSMANKGMSIKLATIVDVEYKRIPCEYKNQNLSLRIEESTQKPHYLAITFLYQAGQTEIVAVDVAQVGSSHWGYMSRNHGAVWDTSNVPVGALQFRLVVTGGYDGKTVWVKKGVPVEWRVGMVYDLGVQISDIAQEGCSPCDTTTWK